MRKAREPEDGLIGRRPLLAFGGLGALSALFGRTGRAQTGPRVVEYPTDEAANLQLVREFCSAWSTMDLGRVTAFLSEDSVSRITLDLRPLVGPEAVVGEMQQWMESSTSIDFDILESYVKGPVVVTHRIDTFASDTRPVTWEGVGVFRIDDGKIVEWSDHTIQVTIPSTG